MRYDYHRLEEAAWAAIVAAIIAVAQVVEGADFSDGWTWVPVAAGAAGRAVLGAVAAILRRP